MSSPLNDFNLAYRFDKNLRDVPDDPAEVERAVAFLWTEVQQRDLDPRRRARLYGWLGSCLRMLGRLDEAEQTLKTALAFAREARDARLQVANSIRLAHVYHWQGKWERAESLFSQIVARCRREASVTSYLDFAYQHAGKCRFDQGEYADAQAFFEEALAIRRQKGSEELIASTQHALAVTRQRWTEIAREDREEEPHVGREHR